jgi:hypothetical protein
MERRVGPEEEEVGEDAGGDDVVEVVEVEGEEADSEVG